MKKREITSLQKFVSKEFKTKELLPFETEVLICPKNTCLTLPGQIEENIYFIHSGVAQASIASRSENYEDKIVSFSKQNQFICSLSSFISSTPASYTISCTTKCVLERIARDRLYEAMEYSILANKLMLYITNWSYLYRLKKQTDYITKTALERYYDLLKEEPELVKILPVATLAKYLGIHSRSLSRIRKMK